LRVCPANLVAAYPRAHGHGQQQNPGPDHHRHGHDHGRRSGQSELEQQYHLDRRYRAVQCWAGGPPRAPSTTSTARTPRTASRGSSGWKSGRAGAATPTTRASGAGSPPGARPGGIPARQSTPTL